MIFSVSEEKNDWKRESLPGSKIGNLFKNLLRFWNINNRLFLFFFYFYPLWRRNLYALNIGISKGQLISKVDWRAIDSPKKRTEEFVLFAFLLFMANKSNSSVCFLGEFTVHQSAFRFYLTFITLPLCLKLIK